MRHTATNGLAVMFSILAMHAAYLRWYRSPDLLRQHAQALREREEQYGTRIEQLSNAPFPETEGRNR
jgi:hypothetical protein